MRDTIFYFTDLEGTILREADGKFDKEKFKKLLEQLAKLQENLNATVKINIVSPIYMDQMKELVDTFDNQIAEFNQTAGKNILEPINSAVAFSKETFSGGDYRYDVIEPFPGKILDGGERGKSVYVNNWIEAYPDAKLYIYAGNGRNDILAMKKVKSKSRGFVICPKNSRTEVKNISNFASDKEDIEGIIEGLEKINEAVLARKESNKNLTDDLKDR